MSEDYIMPGVPCAFFNFEGHFELEAKIRKLIPVAMNVHTEQNISYIKTVELFKKNNITNVTWSYFGVAVFWYIGGKDE